MFVVSNAKTSEELRNDMVHYLEVKIGRRPYKRQTIREQKYENGQADALKEVLDYLKTLWINDKQYQDPNSNQ